MRKAIQPEKAVHTVADAEATFRSMTKKELYDMMSADEHLMWEAKNYRNIEGFDTRSHLATLLRTRQLIARTYDDFRMLCGSDYIAKTMRDDFRDMLLRLFKREGNARVIVVDGPTDAFQSLQEEFPKTLHVAQGNIPEETEICHFLVGDGMYTRREMPHTPITPDMPSQTIRATVHLHNRAVGEVEKTRFGAMWERLTEEVIDPKKVKKRKWWHFGT